MGQADLYYLGLDTTRATYKQGSGREIRHSIGTRLFNHQPGAPFEPGFDYNWELVYQLGTFGQNYINAWTVSTETGFTFPIRFTPRLALRADVASGGQHPNGGTLNTFNPLFRAGHISLSRRHRAVSRRQGETEPGQNGIRPPSLPGALATPRPECAIGIGGSRFSSSRKGSRQGADSSRNS